MVVPGCPLIDQWLAILPPNSFLPVCDQGKYNIKGTPLPPLSSTLSQPPTFSTPTLTTQLQKLSTQSPFSQPHPHTPKHISNVFGFGEHHSEVYGSEGHKSSWSHELIAGAAAFEAMKSVENGRPEDKHKLTKEIFAGLAAMEADKLFETKGLDFLDRERAKHEAKKNAERIYDEKYQ